MSRENRNNNKNYVIEICYKKKTINNIFENEVYAKLLKEPENSHFCGFIYNKGSNDYLCNSSTNGFIRIWDLLNKSLNTTIEINGCLLVHIIQWSMKYIILADYNNKSFKFIGLTQKKMIKEITEKHDGYLKCVIYPIYGESLITGGENDNKIILWS